MSSPRAWASKCDLRAQDNFTYTEEPSKLDELREEVDAAGVAGLPVSLEGLSDLPFEIAGAVGCADRAEFHQGQVPAGLARALDSRGVAVHEQTRARRGRQGDDGNRRPGG